MKASLPKFQALKFIVQIAASKLRFFQTSSFQKLVEKIQIYIKEFWLILKNEFGALILSVFLKKTSCFASSNWLKQILFSIEKMKADKIANFFPIYRILAFEIYVLV